MSEDVLKTLKEQIKATVLVLRHQARTYSRMIGNLISEAEDKDIETSELEDKQSAAGDIDGYCDDMIL